MYFGRTPSEKERKNLIRNSYMDADDIAVMDSMEKKGLSLRCRQIYIEAPDHRDIEKVLQSKKKRDSKEGGRLWV